MNTTVAVVLPAWAVWLLMMLCVVSFLEITVRAINHVLMGMLERRMKRHNTEAQRAAAGGPTGAQSSTR